MLSTLLRRAALAATGSTYVILGADAVRTPGARIGMAAPMLASMRKVMPLPAEDEQIVRANAAVQTIAGAVLLTGAYRKYAAAALIASLVPTTVAGHDFWNVEDPMARKMQRTQFHKNVAMLGGLLFALCEPEK